jgi:TonB-dependent receptor
VHISKADKNEHLQLANFTMLESANYLILLEGNRTTVTDITNRVRNPDYFRDSSVQDNFLLSEDKRSGGDINLLYKWDAARIANKLEGGLFYDAREKSFRRNYARYTELRKGMVPRMLMSDPVFFGGYREGFLSELGDASYDFGPIFHTGNMRRFINDPASAGVVFDQTVNDVTFTVTDALLRDYDATEDIAAAYLMHTLDYGRLRLIAGMRYEETKNTFTNNDILTRSAAIPPTIPFVQPSFWKRLIELLGQDSFITAVRRERSYDHLLGALHGIYRHGDSLVLRSAITQTIARSDYNDLVPREIVGVSGAQYANSVRLPNFELRPLESLNFDLSADYYFKGLGYVSAGIFYKDLDGPVYTETKSVAPGDPVADYLTNKYRSNPAIDSTEWVTERRVNAGKGDLYGLELVFERKFRELPGLLSGLGVAANFSLMESSVRFPMDDKYRGGEKVPLFLQPDKLANFSLSWEKHGLLVRASLLYKGKTLDDAVVTGERIEELVKENLPTNAFDIYTKESIRLDMLVRYRMRKGLALYFEGTNLTNEPIERYRGERWRLYTIRYTKPVYFAGIRWSY